MRLWTVHPKFLDSQGLVALWRESLLARAVLRGMTRGYRHHPQLARFRAHSKPRPAISAYLQIIYDEARVRGYSFDVRKIGPVREVQPIRVTSGQFLYEWKHLLRKLSVRKPSLYRQWRKATPEVHPLFQLRAGPIEPWERVED